MIASDITATQIAPSLIGLFAFVLAYYTLVARERKNPLITVSLTRVAIAGLVSLFFAVCERLWAFGIYLRDVPYSNGKPVAEGDTSQQVRFVLLCLSGASVVVAIGMMFWRVLVIHNIQNRLRSDKLIRNTHTFLGIKTWYRRLRSRPVYEHAVKDVPGDLLKQASEILGLQSALPDHQSQLKLTPSILLAPRHRNRAEDALVRLASLAIDQKLEVVYTTCSRHPIEFISRLKAHREASQPGTWSTAVNQLFVVDGFTTHFGFSDGIHLLRAHDLEAQGLHYVRPEHSFSGLHTAAAEVFNKVKTTKGSKPPRDPQLVIYEGLTGLVDLESAEQFRIFFRHVIPSERQWGGMLTVVVEPGASQSDRDFLAGLVDFVSPPPQGDAP